MKSCKILIIAFIYLDLAKVFSSAAFTPSVADSKGIPLPSGMAPRPNIVLVLSDDQSFPHLHCLGATEMKTPNLDQFAAEGIMLNQMFVTSPQCAPSRGSLLTGRSPMANSMTRFSAPLPRQIITFPELLRTNAGYFVGILGRIHHLDSSPASDQAPISEKVLVEHHLRTAEDRFNYVDTSGQLEVPERMREFFDQRPKDKPYFLEVNFNNPHYPWPHFPGHKSTNPPTPATIHVPGFLPDLPGVRDALSRYEGDCEMADTDFQTVLNIITDRAGLTNTLIFYMSDNGFAFPGGKGMLHDAGLHVPMLAWWPGVIKPGSKSEALISGEDFAPTCLEAAGLPVPSSMSGKSFLPALEGNPYAGNKFIFGERGPHGSATFTLQTKTDGTDYSRCVRTTHYKLIYNVTPRIPFNPVDSMDEPYWKEMTQAHLNKTLAKPFETLYFTNPRPVYELYDLDQDPNELTNVVNDAALTEVVYELKEALQEKMIVDFDYLPLPIPPVRKP